jgi:hypothetical protein
VAVICWLPAAVAAGSSGGGQCLGGAGGRFATLEDLAVHAAVDARLAVEPVEARAAIEPVVTRAAEQPVVADLHVNIDRGSEAVDTWASAEPVVALAALDDIVTRAAVQPVLARCGEGHRVVAAAPEQHVVAGVIRVEAGADLVVAGPPNTMSASNSPFTMSSPLPPSRTSLPESPNTKSSPS